MRRRAPPRSLAAPAQATSVGTGPSFLQHDPPPGSAEEDGSGSRPSGARGDACHPSSPPEFHILPLDWLRGHEQHRPERVDELVAAIVRSGVFHNPIWVSKGTWVILNGHHRVEAMRRLGMKFIPAWVFDYDGDHVDLGRWRPGPPILKSEVVHRARNGHPFPPKTTRHRLRVELPRRSVPLEELKN